MAAVLNASKRRVIGTKRRDTKSHGARESLSLSHSEKTLKVIFFKLKFDDLSSLVGATNQATNFSDNDGDDDDDDDDDDDKRPNFAKFLAKGPRRKLTFANSDQTSIRVLSNYIDDLIKSCPNRSLTKLPRLTSAGDEHILK